MSHSVCSTRTEFRSFSYNTTCIWSWRGRPQSNCRPTSAAAAVPSALEMIFGALSRKTESMPFMVLFMLMGLLRSHCSTHSPWSNRDERIPFVKISEALILVFEPFDRTALNPKSHQTQTRQTYTRCDSAPPREALREHWRIVLQPCKIHESKNSRLVCPGSWDSTVSFVRTNNVPAFLEVS